MLKKSPKENAQRGGSSGRSHAETKNERRGRSSPDSSPNIFPGAAQPEREQLATFVRVLFKYASPASYVSLRTFGKGNKALSIRGVKVSSGDVVEYAYEEAEKAAALTQVAVFSPPVATFVGRKLAREADVVDGVAIGVELDANPQQALAILTKLLGKPTMVVASGGLTEQGEPKLHVYWRLAKPARGEERALLREARRLAAKLAGADPSGVALCHPMRWPGSLHRKKEPAVLCKIVQLNEDREVDLQQVLELLREEVPTEPKKKSSRTINNLAPVPIEEIMALLAIIPSDFYPVWMECGPALYKQLGDEVGRPIWHEWSKKSKKYDEKYCDEKWDECAKFTSYNVNTLYHWAGEFNPEWRDARREEQVRQNINIGDEVDEPILPTVLTLPEMIDRLVWVGGSGSVVDKVTARARKYDVAGREYAASVHIVNGKKKGHALPHWLASQNRMSVDVLAWVPGAEQICASPEDEGDRAFNTWRGFRPMNTPKDWKKLAKAFVDHVAYLVPNKNECRRFMQWLAHIVQCPEVLPHTYYVMIAKTHGIGRNLLVGMITRALRGYVANGISLPDLLDGKFNGRLSRKLLATVDELREGNSSGRYQRQEALKSIITQEHRHINPKFGTQSVEKNCCRWLMLSNHLDAVPLDNKDRRANIIENPLVPKPPEYYERLYQMLDDPLFAAAIRKTLQEWDISDFKPGEHAPMTAAKVKALESMQTDTERACLQFKEDCETDIAAREDIDWLASDNGKKQVNAYHLSRSIEAAGMISYNKRIKHRGARKTIVVVRNHDVWTHEAVQQSTTERLLKAMGLTEEYGSRG